jgi:hypothetical protein
MNAVEWIPISNSSNPGKIHDRVTENLQRVVWKNQYVQTFFFSKNDISSIPNL